MSAWFCAIRSLLWRLWRLRSEPVSEPSPHIKPQAPPLSRVMDGPVLRTDNLAADAGPLRLFSGLSFTLQSGSALILRGENGSGKTTLLRVIAGLYPKVSGAVFFENQDASETYDAAQNCHFLGHKNGLKTAQSVRENLKFFARFDGPPARSAADINSIITSAAERLALTPLLDLPVGLLSAGQTRRAAFARLLMSPRPIWCLDEPTAALDVASSQTAERLCRAHLDSGGFVIASTHLPFLKGAGNVQDLTLGGAENGHAPDLEPAS